MKASAKVIKPKVVFPILVVLFITGSVATIPGLRHVRAAPSAAISTLVLYDAALGAIPAAPLVGFTDFPPGAATPIYADGVTILDTTSAGSDTYAGWVTNGAATPGFPSLDRVEGFQVNFTLQVEAESHDSNHRAGFSIIILSQDSRGLELAFWENEIWAQGDDSTGGLFRHGEGIAFNTSTGLTEYQVTIAGDAYTLSADAQPILSGPVRDYSNFDGFPDPYETPNFLFFGDDTTSAQARVRLSFISVTGTQPVSPTSTGFPTNTSSPLPTASFTPPPSATPIPLPTPTPAPVGVCPSGWILLAVMIPAAVLIKKNRAGH